LRDDDTPGKGDKNETDPEGIAQVEMCSIPAGIDSFFSPITPDVARLRRAQSGAILLQSLPGFSGIFQIFTNA
jgi:hypothetical protein